MDCSPPSKDFHFNVGSLGKSQVSLGAGGANAVAAGGASTFAAPSVSPAYLGVGYIIGLKLASLQFAGGVLAWGLMVPLIIFFLGPQIHHYLPADTTRQLGSDGRGSLENNLPIAVGGMLVGAAYTLVKMGKSLTAGLGRALSDLQTSDEQSKLAAAPNGT